MELKHDWKALNQILFPFDRVDPYTHRSLVLLQDGGTVQEGIVTSGMRFDDKGEDLGTMDKSKLDAMASKYDAEHTIALESLDFRGFLDESLALAPNYFKQLEHLKARTLEDITGSGAPRGANKSSKKSAEFAVNRRHFILELFSGPLSKIMPKVFHLLILIDESANEGSFSAGSSAPTTAYRNQSILIKFQAGKVEEFFEPDFSDINKNRLDEWEQDSGLIVDYLQSRYLIPTYALFIAGSAWRRCLSDATVVTNPWRELSLALEEGSARFEPQSPLFRTALKSLLAGQRVMGYFAGYFGRV